MFHHKALLDDNLFRFVENVLLTLFKLHFIQNNIPYKGFLARWRNNFFQLLNVHGVNDVRQAEKHTAEPLVPEPSDSEVETAIEKLERHKSPGIDQIPAELIKA
jgi:hypothetical protein